MGDTSHLLAILMTTIHIILNRLVLLRPVQVRGVLVLESVVRGVGEEILELDLLERGAEKRLGLEGVQGIRTVCFHQVIGEEERVL